MDAWLVSFTVGFAIGFAIGLRLWWTERRRRIVAEKLLRTPVGKLVMRQ